MKDVMLYLLLAQNIGLILLLVSDRRNKRDMKALLERKTHIRL